MEMLDDSGLYERLDRHQMWTSIEDFPQQIEHAREIGLRVDLPDELAGADQILAVGMGGSAIGADLLRTYCDGRTATPFVVHRGYDLPQFATSATLVIVASYSGNTAETISVYREARKRHCQLLVITTGGNLGALAIADGIPCCLIPGGYMPRAAIGYSFFPLLTALERLGYLPSLNGEVEETAEVVRNVVEQFGITVPLGENLMKQLAQSLVGRAPLVYGSEGWSDVLAMRWKCQFNENSKNVAFHNSVPELCHNEIEGWAYPPDLHQALHLIVIRERNSREEVVDQIRAVRELVEPRIAGVTDVWSSGTGTLAQLFSLVQAGDFASLYLAMLNGVDPTAMPNITWMKEKMG